MASSPAPQVQIEGLKELQRTAKKAGVDMREFGVASQRAGAIVVSAAMGRVPRVTGALAGTIRPAKQKARVVIYAGNNTSVPYAGPIHWGWPARNIRASPFLTEAGKATESQWIAAYTDELNAILGRIHGT